MYIIIYILASLVVAFWGMNRKFGFWGYFFGSLLLSPLVGVLLVCASEDTSGRAKS